MSESKSKGLIPLDFDGVLNTGSTEVYESMIHDSLIQAGVEIDPGTEKEEITRLWGTPPEKIMLSFIKDNPKAVKKAVGHYRKLYREDFPNRIGAVDGSVEALEALRSADYALALNTAADGEILREAILPSLGIDPALFDGGIIAAENIPDPKLYKPDPYAINELIIRNRHRGISRVNTLMVGDSAADVLAAYQANVEAVVTLTGNLTREVASEYLGVAQNYIIESVAHLPKVVHRHIGWATLSLATCEV